MRISDPFRARPVLNRAGIAALALAVSGCLPQSGSLAFLGPAPLQAVRVSDNGVTVVGPEGYCIDPASSAERPAGSFVILGSCATLRGTGAGPGRPAVLTALVSPPSDPPLVPTVAELERFFRSAAGQAALAHDGDADSVTLLEIEARDPVLFLKLRDTSAARPAELSDQSWRAIFPLRDRLVALSAAGHDDLPVGDADMRRTLDSFVDALRAANPEVLADSDT
jgi:hypothetical protein